MKGNKNARKGTMYRFYLIPPKEDTDAGRFAERLLSLGPVDEVYITDGDIGYIVKAHFQKDEEPRDVTKYIERNVARKYGKIVSYYQYKK
ncbi:MAG: hypothetical protein M1160_03840 [Candidatus Marsarchaeota archaeon]|jgi:hypothetical protein|nr:hypothetical protein [Candidatus Marsarchaeota archaeon]MCL5111974.1 hypothetical protein [Candidatus Marsarchaeota archaeon]